MLKKQKKQKGLFLRVQATLRVSLLASESVLYSYILISHSYLQCDVNSEMLSDGEYHFTLKYTVALYD